MVLHKCLICNNNWNTKPNYILHMDCGCPFCSASKGEKLIGGIIIKDDTKKWRVNQQDDYDYDKNDLTKWEYFDNII